MIRGSTGSTSHAGRGGVTAMRARVRGVIPKASMPSSTGRPVRFRMLTNECSRVPPGGPVTMCPSRARVLSISRSHAHFSHSMTNADSSIAVNNPRRSNPATLRRQNAFASLLNQRGIVAVPSSSSEISTSDRRDSPALVPPTELGRASGPSPTLGANRHWSWPELQAVTSVLSTLDTLTHRPMAPAATAYDPRLGKPETQRINHRVGDRCQRLAAIAACPHDLDMILMPPPAVLTHP